MLILFHPKMHLSLFVRIVWEAYEGRPCMSRRYYPSTISIFLTIALTYKIDPRYTYPRNKGNSYQKNDRRAEHHRRPQTILLSGCPQRRGGDVWRQSRAYRRSRTADQPHGEVAGGAGLRRQSADLGRGTGRRGDR